MTCHYVFMLQTIHQPQHPLSEVIQMRSAFLWPFQFLHHWSCLNQFSLSKNNALILDFIKSSSFLFLISSSPNILFSSRASCCFPAPPCNMCKKFSSPCLSLVKILLFLIFIEVICQAQHEIFYLFFLNITPTKLVSSCILVEWPIITDPFWTESSKLNAHNVDVKYGLKDKLCACHFLLFTICYYKIEMGLNLRIWLAKVDLLKYCCKTNADLMSFINQDLLILLSYFNFISNLYLNMKRTIQSKYSDS